jgi:hypothetical protein
MAIGSLITASDYNVIQSKVGNVLGNGVGQSGYGQILNSSQVPVEKTVNSNDIEVLRLDTVKAYVHQTGTLPVLPTVSVGDEIPYSIYQTYSNVADSVYTNKNLINIATQASAENKLSSSRSTLWGGVSTVQKITHEFSVTFLNVDSRRHFFNAGGEIRISAAIINGSGSKTSTWVSMLSSMAYVKFSYNATTASSGTGSNIGNFNLTSAYQQVFVKYGTSIYSDNYVSVKAKGEQSSNIATFMVELFDGTSNLYDESVNGTITSSVSQLRPTGLYVSVPSPIYANLTTLS